MFLNSGIFQYPGGITQLYTVGTASQLFSLYYTVPWHTISHTLKPAVGCSSSQMISHQYERLPGETPTVTTDDDHCTTALQLVNYILG